VVVNLPEIINVSMIAICVKIAILNKHMETLEKYNYIKQKCVEANGSILDLKFGCKVLTLPMYAGISEDEEFECTVRRTIDERILVDERANTISIYSITKILGREIRLADILLALRKTRPPYRILIDTEISGNSILIGVKEDKIKNFVEWNLLNDSLSWHKDNAPETIDFLYEILK
jgi:hypothetical protein